MKKILRNLFLWAMAACLVLLTACGGGKLPDWADTEVLDTQARAVIDTMNALDYEGVAALYDNPEVTADIFESSGETISAMGAFTGYGDAVYVGGKAQDGQEYATVIQVADYENGKLTFTVSFFEDGTLAGFFMKA